MWVVIVALALLIPGATGAAEEQPASERPRAEYQYERERRFGALRLSTDELGAIIEAVEQYLGPGKHGGLTLKGEGESATVSGDYSANALKSAPSRATEVTYWYRGANGEDIERVRLHLNHYSREVSVRGSNLPKVESLANDIEIRLGAHERLFGGWGPTVVILFIVFGITSTPALVFWLRQEYNKANLLITVPLVLAVVLFVWPRPLLGLVVYRGAVPSPWTTIANNAAALVTLLVSAVAVSKYIAKRLAERRSSEDHSPEDVESK